MGLLQRYQPHLRAPPVYIQPDRIVQRILIALDSSFGERLLDHGQILIQRRSGIVHDFEIRLTRRVSTDLQLSSHFANLNDRIVSLGQLVPNLQPKLFFA